MPDTNDILLGVVHAAGGNLAEVARRLRIPRDTVVSRLRRLGLLDQARRVREEHRGTEIEQLRQILDGLRPSDRVRALPAAPAARDRLLDEIAQRNDLDRDARERLRRARRATPDTGEQGAA